MESVSGLSPSCAEGPVREMWWDSCGGGNAQFDETQALVSDQNTMAVSIRGEQTAGICGTVEFSEVFSII